MGPFYGLPRLQRLPSSPQEGENVLPEASELDFWRSPSHPKEPVDVKVPFTSLQAVKVLLESHQIDYSILIEDVQALLDEESREMQSNRQREYGNQNFNYGAYHNLDTIYQAMDDIVMDYPQIVSKLQIGQTYEKRPLFVLKKSKVLHLGKKNPKYTSRLGETSLNSRNWERISES
uniref:Uncharacterized protein n=1 Tax=Laticauda laticaudata TaxID=8630 RepID=A0A8C5SAI4_LATLA